jgi:HSP20 family protein
MKQTDKQYIITMDIPGMEKDKINVETKEGMLIISGERQSET